MKILIAIVATFGLASFIAVGQATNAAPPQVAAIKRISAAEAEKHYDETVTVTGKVAQVSIRPRVVYLNLDKKFPEAPMYCVIFGRATNQFGDLKKLEGKQVEVTGKIEEYQAKAQIILNSSNQLTVIGKAAQAGDSKKP
jgi:exonuclease VII large subunit